MKIDDVLRQLAKVEAELNRQGRAVPSEFGRVAALLAQERNTAQNGTVAPQLDIVTPSPLPIDLPEELQPQWAVFEAFFTAINQRFGWPNRDQYLVFADIAATLTATDNGSLPNDQVWSSFIAMLTKLTSVLGELNNDQYLLVLITAARLTTAAGASGETPFIGENDNWWIGDTDTGVSAQGLPGPPGPPGAQGPPGQGLTARGTVPTEADLPTSGNEQGDLWIAEDTGIGWMWDGTQWLDLGPVRGPTGPAGATGPPGANGADSTVPGPQGPPGADSTVPGPQGPAGAASTVPGPTGPAGPASTVPGPAGPAGSAATVAAGTTATGTPGSAASVVNAGSTSAAVFDFTIPAGQPGAAGPPGAASTVPGPAGPAGPASTVPGPQGPAGPAGSPGITEAPSDGNIYGRQNASWTALALPTPQGRLSLSTAAVMTADVVGATVIYYVPYVGNCIPIYVPGGTLEWIVGQFSSPLQITLNSGIGGQGAGNLYDLYVRATPGTSPSGWVPQLVISMPGASGVGLNGWGSLTARSAANALTLANGLWVNAQPITVSTGPGASASIAAGQGTYVGTFYTSAAGQTQMNFAPGAAVGGVANCMIGLWNAYNRVGIRTINVDATATWTDTPSSWRPTNGSVNNRIYFVDGLGQSPSVAQLFVRASIQAPAYPEIGVSFNTVAFQFGVLVLSSPVVGLDNSMTVRSGSPPVLGFNYWSGLEAIANPPGVTFLGGGFEELSLELDA